MKKRLVKVTHMRKNGIEFDVVRAARGRLSVVVAKTPSKFITLTRRP